MTRLATLAVVSALLVAGCTGVGPLESDSGTPVEQQDRNEPLVDRDGPPYPDPWPGSPTVVAINATATDERDVEPIVDSALQYWADNDDRYARYTTTFDLRPDATDPDVVIEFVPEIETCGHNTTAEAVGCAPVLSNQTLADRPTVVQIETGFTDESTELIIEHELGHVFGLGHGDEPAALMSAWTDRLNELPQPDVTEREYTWAKANLTVYVDRASLPGSDREIDRQIDAALGYYNDGAEGFVPANITLSLTDDRAAADIVIRGGDIERASNESLNGLDVDTDPAIEYFTSQTIVINTAVDPARIGWHVGFWLGDSLIQPETPAGLPPPFDDPETDPREDW